MRKIGLLVLILFSVCSGCTSMTYQTSGVAVAKVLNRGEFPHQLSAKGRKEFFLWGMLPEKHTVYIDEELSLEGPILGAGGVQVREYQTVTNFLLSVFSFGMYVPMNYEITGWVRRPIDE